MDRTIRDHLVHKLAYGAASRHLNDMVHVMYSILFSDETHIDIDLENFEISQLLLIQLSIRVFLLNTQQTEAIACIH
jgi:hypothetical protein